jgi:hypothetical protein
MRMPTDVLRSKARVTGVSVLGFGVALQYSDSEKAIASRIVTFLEGRRVLFERLASRCPGGVIDSLASIRTKIQEAMEGLDRRSDLFIILQKLRQEVLRFISSACGDCAEARSCKDCTIQREGCAAHLGEFRKSFAGPLAELCIRFDLDLDEELAAIVTG